MSREMRDFASHFMKGMEMGGKWANQWQEQAIAQERNRLAALHHKEEMEDKRKRTEFYGMGVMADAEKARALAHKALNPTVKGGGGATDTSGNAQLEALDKKWEGRGVPVLGDGPVAPTAPPGPLSLKKGGMVKKYAGGGSIEEGAGMSIGQALAYGVKSKPNAASSAASNFAAAVAKSQSPKQDPKKDPKKDPMQQPTIAEDWSVGKRVPPEEFTGTGTTYQRGGRVAPTTAIDVGMSGPGSGYGQRAAPPPRERRHG